MGEGGGLGVYEDDRFSLVEAGFCFGFGDAAGGKAGCEDREEEGEAHDDWRG